MRLLVTRPEPDASDLAAQLQALGHEAVIEPLTRIEPVPHGLPAGPVAAVLLTSRHAAAQVAIGEDRSDILDAPAFCVGKATAAAARSAGFRRAGAAAGTVAALAEAVAEQCNRDGGPLVYLRGRDVSSDLAGTLRSEGFTVIEQVVYEAQARDRLSDSTARRLRNGEIDGVVFMSARSARIFAGLVARSGLAGTVAGAVAYCLSDAVASPLDALDMRAQVAPSPTLAALLVLIGASPR